MHTEDAPLGDRITAAYRADECSRLTDDIEFTLNPGSSVCVLREYWREKMNGNAQKAFEIYQQASRDGILLPAM